MSQKVIVTYTSLRNSFDNRKGEKKVDNIAKSYGGCPVKERYQGMKANCFSANTNGDLEKFIEEVEEKGIGRVDNINRGEMIKKGKRFIVEVN